MTSDERSEVVAQKFAKMVTAMIECGGKLNNA
ncbi:hypothetical protein [Falsihalocynthiibacter arcticus]|nr:hypothetical protein [Falsihalocynthiibacter arcticus]